jgi:hypothetical protein
LAAWAEVAARRITEWRAIPEPEPGDFPPVPEVSDEARAAALGRLDRRHRELPAVVAGLDAGILDLIVPGEPYPVAVMLHGTAQHYGYHTGQVALLKKLVGRGE